jgi:hypothetical protein
MATPLEELERRITRMEQELARLQQLVEKPSQMETPAECGARLFREAQRNQATISAIIAQAFAEMGITGAPIGAEKVQEMMCACGMQPDANEFSQGIIAMREESV